MSWHVDTDLLSRYAARDLDAAAAWSVESHVTACPDCRAKITQHSLVPSDRLTAIARRVQTRLDAPTPSAVERFLQVVGVPQHLARLLAATPSLTLSWLAAVGFVLAVAVVSARWGWQPQNPMDRSLLLFLTVAPLVPLAGIAAAFGPNVDPTYEIGLAAPMRSGRLLLVRAVAVLASSLLIAGACAVFLPTLGWTVVAWIVPALAVSATTLALSTSVSPLWAASTVGAIWLLLVLGSEAVADVRFAAFGTSGQAVAATVLAVATAVVWSGRDRFEQEVQV